MSESIELKGKFQIINWDEQVLAEAGDGSKRSHASISQRYKGGLRGESTINYLMVYTDAANAVFVGYELLECQLDGDAGSCILAHEGVFGNGVAQSSFQIVPGSGKGAWKGVAGEGSFSAPMGSKAEYRLELFKPEN